MNPVAITKHVKYNWPDEQGILQKAVENGYIEWNRYALERMMERGISKKQV